MKYLFLSIALLASACTSTVQTAANRGFTCDGADPNDIADSCRLDKSISVTVSLPDVSSRHWAEDMNVLTERALMELRMCAEMYGYDPDAVLEEEVTVADHIDITHRRQLLLAWWSPPDTGEVKVPTK